MENGHTAPTVWAWVNVGRINPVSDYGVLWLAFVYVVYIEVLSFSTPDQFRVHLGPKPRAPFIQSGCAVFTTVHPPLLLILMPCSLHIYTAFCSPVFPIQTPNNYVKRFCFCNIFCVWTLEEPADFLHVIVLVAMLLFKFGCPFAEVNWHVICFNELLLIKKAKISHRPTEHFVWDGAGGGGGGSGMWDRKNANREPKRTRLN